MIIRSHIRKVNGRPVKVKQHVRTLAKELTEGRFEPQLDKVKAPK